LQRCLVDLRFRAGGNVVFLKGRNGPRRSLDYAVDRKNVAVPDLESLMLGKVVLALRVLRAMSLDEKVLSDA
jgi:hypothetical protein